MTREQQIAWAAGFFDGEGCVNISKCINHQVMPKKGPMTYLNYQLVLVIGQKRREPLDRFAEIFGGGINVQRRWGWPFFYFRRNGTKAVVILEQILPLLTVKKAAAELGMSFQRYHDLTKPSPMWRGREPEEVEVLENMYDIMKATNKKHDRIGDQVDHTAPGEVM